MEGGTWDMEGGTWDMEAGIWDMEAGTWDMEAGTCPRNMAYVSHPLHWGAYQSREISDSLC